MNIDSAIECKNCKIPMRLEFKAENDVGIKERIMEKLFYKCPRCGKNLVYRRLIPSKQKR